VSFAAITLCIASQRVFIVVSTYFFMTQSGNFWIHHRTSLIYAVFSKNLGTAFNNTHIPEANSDEPGKLLSVDSFQCTGKVSTLKSVLAFGRHFLAIVFHTGAVIRSENP
jgi:hypothetical protein